MDYSDKSRDELIAICKTKKIKGYSSKKKEEIIQLLNAHDTAPREEKEEKEEKEKKEEHDDYTEEYLKERYQIECKYINELKTLAKKRNTKSARMPVFPEEISENIIKFIIRNKLNDKTTTWSCNFGDLYSKKQGKIECKCFTSNGPSSFTPTSEWDVIYFLDARKWTDDHYVLYQVALKMSSPEWKNIKMNKTDTFGDQAKQKRRPRINWLALYPQIENYCTIVYEGTFDNIFTPLEGEE